MILIVLTCCTSFSYCIVVDCGLPLIEDDSILQLVPSAEQSTKYNNQIQFYCSSKYYKLEGNGDFQNHLHICSQVELMLCSFSNVLLSIFQTHIFAVPAVNGSQWMATKGCQNVLKVGYCFFFHSIHLSMGAFLTSFCSL